MPPTRLIRLPPIFDRIVIGLDEKFYGKKSLEIQVVRTSENAKYIRKIEIGGKQWNAFRITHHNLVNAGKIVFYLE